MGIKFYCPNGHKVNVKSFLAGKKGLCPKCGVRVDIPLHSVSTGQSTATLTNGTTSLIDPDELVDQISSVAPTAEASNGMTLVQEKSQFDATQQPADSESEVSLHNLSEHFTAGSAAKTHDEALHADDLRLPPGFAHGVSSPTADPVWHIQFANGEQFGPLDDTMLQSWLAEGRISPDDLIWRQGWPQWESAMTVFPHGRQSVGHQTTIAPSPNRADNPLIDALETGLPKASSSNWFSQRHRGKREIRARLSLVLLGLVILLFALLLYVFFMRDQSSQPKETSMSARPTLRQGCNPDLLAIQRNHRIPPDAGFS
jgi:GYF domain 2